MLIHPEQHALRTHAVGVGRLDEDAVEVDVASSPRSRRYARFERLGNELPGSGGVAPQLYGRGDLAPGGHGFLHLEQGYRHALAFFIVGAGTLNAPLFQGTLVPTLDLIVVSQVGFWGDVTIGGDLPADLPSGLDFWAQAWVVDPGGPKGFAATNAIRGTTE